MERVIRRRNYRNNRSYDERTPLRGFKKVFLKKEYRSQKVGLALYKELLKYAENKNVRQIILDTPSVAHTSHRFYEKAGFCKISADELPVPYSYPHRDSILYMLKKV